MRVERLERKNLYTYIVRGHSVKYRLWVSVEDNTHFFVEYLSKGQWVPFSKYVENDVLYNRIIKSFSNNIIDTYFTMSNKNGEPVHITANALKRCIGIDTGKTGQKTCAIYGMGVKLHYEVKSPIDGKVKIHKFPLERLHEISNDIMPFTPNNIELMGRDKRFLKFQREMCAFQFLVCCVITSEHSHTHTIVEYYYRNSHVRSGYQSNCFVCYEHEITEKDAWQKNIDFVQYPCKHLICNDCNDRWKQNGLYGRKTFTCPFCRMILDKRINYPIFRIRDMLEI